MVKDEIDSNLFKRFKSGENAAFAAVHDRYFHSIYYFAKSLVSREMDAYDIVAESFLRMMNSYETFNDAAHIKRFLFQVTRNLAIDLFRKKRKEHLTHKELLYLSDEAEECYYQERIAALYLETLHEAIENLPNQSREVLKLILKNKTIKEIASIMGLSPQTVRNYKISALKSLKDRFLSSPNHLMVAQTFLILLLSAI